MEEQTAPDPDDDGPQAAPRTRYVYDAAGRVTLQIQVLGALDGGEDRPEGDSDDLVAETVYDAAGRVEKTIVPLGRQPQYF